VSDERRGRDKITREDDPEERWPDPETELPNVPEAPEAPPASEASPTVAAAFWKSVLVVNYAVFAVCFGPMLIYFRGQTVLGASIFASGLFAFGYASLIYRAFRRRNREDDDPEDQKA
jgi:hypothetical protein